MITNWRKNILTKKGFRYAMAAPRAVLSRLSSETSYLERPPILANSFPKSGTHLLIQILQVLPGVRDWGLFLASTPSFTFKKISPMGMGRKIRLLVPGELAGAHLFHSTELSAAIREKPVSHFFIYRDPRDVVISEAHYLTKMNRWHRLSKYFRALPNMEERISFSITGALEADFPYDYPDIAQRFELYKGWIDDPGVFALRYEDLMSDKREAVVEEVIRFFSNTCSLDYDQNTYVTKALDNINPAKSHTYRKGKAGGWRGVFTESQKDKFKQIAGDLLIELKYEQDKNW